MRFSLTISRYLIGAVLPYFVFAWLLLSVILFVQQASRFSDIFFSANIPTNLIWQLTVALVPSVISFTCPMAVLVGVIIGLSKMQGDSELVAIRAAGVGNVQIAIPILILGIFLSAVAFTINLYGVPLAASIVRRVAVQTAIYKLESPIEPGVFNTELAGYTVYVKDGDISAGTWKNIFIFSEDEKSGMSRLITSRSGRIDTTGQASELVLENAVVSTFTPAAEGEKFVSENIGEFRFAIKTKRGELIEKLSSSEGSPEELGLSQLADYARSKEGSERTEAQIVWQRRITLSLTPIIFCLLGTAMILRFTGRGRGFGIFVALIALICYYLLAFFGEQLGRTGQISVFVGSLIPIAASVVAIVWFTFAGRTSVFRGWPERFGTLFANLKFRRSSARRHNIFVDLTTGLRDFDVFTDLAKYFLLTLGFLTTVFLIFTAFELWKFAGTTEGGIVLLGRYLLYLLPFVYLQLAPSAAMVATLATYVIKSRQNEIVTWISAGQSTYRLLLPCLIFMLALGGFNWIIQEKVAPFTNQKQDQLRTDLRSRGAAVNKSQKYWVANDQRIYSFKMEMASDNELSWSVASKAAPQISALTIYEFADDGSKLQSVYRSDKAFWDGGGIKLGRGATRSMLGDGKVVVETAAETTVRERTNPFVKIRSKPSHLNTSETRAQLDESESDIERRTFAVALEKKYATLIMPFVIALFTAPFSLSLSRKGKVVTVGYAIALWLFFTAVISVFEQLGAGGYTSAWLAMWAPVLLFSMLGIYLLSRVKT
ncbi:MAG: LptF/LptG family permease [Acidobacteriota bacterium]